MDLSALGEYGIDYKAGFTRCMCNQKFYFQFLSMFLEDDTFQRAKAACGEGNDQALFECAHELKGVCGNAALTELCDAVYPLVELLRPGNADAEEVAKSFARVEKAYNRACEGIRQVLSK